MAEQFSAPDSSSGVFGQPSVDLSPSCPRANFIKLLSRKYCLTNFFAKQNIRGGPVATK